jgi:hypothetical protein
LWISHLERELLERACPEFHRAASVPRYMID